MSSLYSPHECVSQENRRFGLSDLGTLFFSFGIGLSVMQTGTVLALGEGSLAYLSLFLGMLVGCLLLGMAGKIGTATGLSSMASLRLSFGSVGIFFPVLLNIIQLIGWGSFGMIMIRDALHFVLQNSFGVSFSPLGLSLVIGGIATFLAISGPLAMVRLFLKKFALWFVLGASIWTSLHLFSLWDSATILHKPPSAFGLGKGFDMAVALPLSYLPVVGDYTRFGRSTSSSFWGIALGYGLGSLWFLSLGVSYTLLSPHPTDTQTLLSHLSLVGAGIPLLLLILNETDNLFVDIHSSSVSVALFHPRLSVRLLCVAVGILCTILTIFVPLSHYVDFIIGVSSLFAPLFGIHLADATKTQRKIQTNPSPSPDKLSWRALILWGLGILFFVLCQNSPVGGALPALGFTFLLRKMSHALWARRTR